MEFIRKYILTNIALFYVLNLYGGSKLDLTSRFYSGIEFSKNSDGNTSFLNCAKGNFLNETLFRITQDNFSCIFQGIAEYSHTVSTISHVNFFMKKCAIMYTKSNLSFKIGLDELVSGVGMVWTPSDVLNPVYSLLYKKEEFYRPQIKSIFLLELFLNLLSKEEILLSSKLIYLPSVLYDIELSKLALAINCNLFGYELFLIDAANIGNLNKSYLGGYFRGFIPYIDFISPYGEFQFISDTQIKKWLIGFQVIPYFIDNTYLYFEHYHNSSGFKTFKDYQTQKLPYFTVGDTLMNYFSLGVVMFDSTFKFSFSVITAIEDVSGLYRVTFSRKVSNNSFVEISFYNLFYRDKSNEFLEGLKKEKELLVGLSTYFGK